MVAIETPSRRIVAIMATIANRDRRLGRHHVAIAGTAGAAVRRPPAVASAAVLMAPAAVAWTDRPFADPREPSAPRREWEWLRPGPLAVSP